MVLIRYLIKSQVRFDRPKIALLLLASAVSCLFSSMMVNFDLSKILQEVSLTGNTLVDSLTGFILVPLYIFFLGDRAVFTSSLAVFGSFVAYLGFKTYFFSRKEEINTLQARGIPNRITYSLLVFPNILVSSIGIIIGFFVGLFVSTSFWIYYYSFENPDYILFSPSGSNELYYRFPFLSPDSYLPFFPLDALLHFLISNLVLTGIILVLVTVIAYRNVKKQFDQVKLDDYDYIFLTKKSSVKQNIFLLIISLFIISGISFSSANTNEIPFFLLLTLTVYLCFIYIVTYLTADILLILPYISQRIAERKLFLTILLFIPFFIVLIVIQSLTGFIPDMTILMLPVELLICIFAFLTIYLVLCIIDTKFELIREVTVRASIFNKRLAHSIAHLPINVTIILMLTLSLSLTTAFTYRTAIEENLAESLFITGSDINMELNSNRFYDIVPMEHIDRINSHEDVIHATRVFVQTYYYVGYVQGLLTTEIMFINVSDFRDVAALYDEFFVGGTVDYFFKKMAEDPASVLIDENKAAEMGIIVGDEVQFISRFGYAFTVRVIGLLKKFPPRYDTSNQELLNDVNSFAVMNIQFATYLVANAGRNDVIGISPNQNWRPTTYYLIKTKKGIIRQNIVEELQQDEELSYFFTGGPSFTVDEVLSDLNASKEAINYQIFGSSTVSILLAGSLICSLFIIADRSRKKILPVEHSVSTLLLVTIFSFIISWLVAALLLLFLDFNFLPITVFGNEITRDLRNASRGLVPSITLILALFSVSLILTTVWKKYQSKKFQSIAP
ncbi:MAG: hypothetical protein ACFFD4_22185 [Candidatus Odinarchaeota archaeon]